jgi:RNA polymerase sigma factor (TIGR02999 family)
MRGIVIDHIRARQADKRGGQFDIVPFETLHDLQVSRPEQVLQIDEALQSLAVTDAALAELVELRFFAGLTFAEIGALRGVSERTVQRDWDKARMLLFGTLSE